MMVNVVRIGNTASKSLYTLFLFIASISPVLADSSYMYDYYSEAGINPTAEYVDQQGNEYIDPASGALTLSYVDLYLPGNGGMDIKVQRSYASKQDETGYFGIGENITGISWTIHFGRLFVGSAGVLCGISNDSSTVDNPVMELPDGSRHQLFLAHFESFRWITKDRWKGECVDGVVHMTSPDGTTYVMDRGHNDGKHWYATRIIDRNGNTLLIDYMLGGPSPGTELLITQVTAYDAQDLSAPNAPVLDGRVVKFYYSNIDQANVRLEAISTFDNETNSVQPGQWPGGQGVLYEYEDIPDYAINYKQLTGVVRPDGTRWTYEYNGRLATGVAGSYAMSKSITPYGGVTEYTYDYVNFDTVSDPQTNDLIMTTAVVMKQTYSTASSGYGVEPGTWNYVYAPGSVLDPGTGLYHDQTTIVTPKGVKILTHVGLWEGNARGLYAIGLPLDHDVRDLDGNLLERVAHQWGRQVISNENHTRPSRPGVWEIGVSAPVLIARGTYRQGANDTTGGNYEMRHAPYPQNDNDLTYLDYFDRYGNPKQLDETGTGTRHTDYTYYHETYGTNGPWLVRQVQEETLVEAGEVNGQLQDSVTSRTFDPVNGNLLSETINGVSTSYQYWQTGDVSVVTDADGYTKRFFDYNRGQPQREVSMVDLNDPTQDIETSRIINDNGTVASITDGRSNTTGFGYDLLNRLTSIDYPIHDDVTVSYHAGLSSLEKRLTRGNFRQSTFVNGFGQTYCTVNRDLASRDVIKTIAAYDALGRKTFESYPSDNGDCNVSGPGTTTEYDILNRVAQVTHDSGETITYQYTTADLTNKTVITNERGISTTYAYSGYGHPDNRWLSIIFSPEQIATVIDRNKMGQIERVRQGNYVDQNTIRDRDLTDRVYSYDSRFYLASIDNPETGLTVYGHDDRGNVISQQVGNSGVTSYTYDGLGRQTLVDYPNDTPDVSLIYDNNSNLDILDNGISRIDYDYDINDNLTSESHVISTQSYSILYGINSQDITESITYPSGRVVEYAPDALGRTTQVGSYITSLTYYPTGHPRQMVYGNGQVTDYTLNNRNWVENISVGSAVDMTYLYDGVGNVQSIEDGVEPNFSGVFSYDGMDRLETADGNWGLGSYVYDELGNIDTYTLGGFSLDYTYERRNKRLKNVRGSTSHDYTYDDYGNVTSNSEYQYTYNDANQLTSATWIISVIGEFDPVTNYFYNGHNMRVSRVNNGIGTYYLYAINGNLIGEYQNDRTQNKEYIYLGSKNVAMIQGDADPVAVIDVLPSPDATEGDVITLDGSGSYDFDGSIVSYQWTQVSGDPVTLSSNSVPSPTFTATTGKPTYNLEFDLRVTDDVNQSNTLRTLITISMLDTDSDGLSDNWEIQYFGDLTQSAQGDYDNDGYSNDDEFLAGYDPTIASPLDTFYSLGGIAGNGEAKLFWQPVDRALSYDIYWSLTPDVTPLNGTLIPNVTGPFTHTGLTNGTTYYYIAVARNLSAEVTSNEIAVIAGQSGWSEPASLRERTISSFDMALGDYQNGLSMLGYVEYGTYENNWIDSIYLFDYENNTQWSPPYLAIEGSSGKPIYGPKVAKSANGSSLVVWEEFDFDTDTVSLRARYYDPATGWGETRVLDSAADVGRINNKIALDDSGNGLIVWVNGEVRASHYNNGWSVGYTIVSTSGNSVSETVAIEMMTTGKTLIGWSEQVTTGTLPYVRDYDASTGWGATVLMGNNGEVADISIDSVGNAMAVLLTPSVDSTGRNLLVRKYDTVAGWSDMEQVSVAVNETANYQVDSALADNGNAFIAWVSGSYYVVPDTLTYVPYYSYFDVTTGWTPQAVIPFHKGEGRWAESIAYPNVSAGLDLEMESDGNVHIFMENIGLFNRYASDYLFVPGKGIRVPDLLGETIFMLAGTPAPNFDLQVSSDTDGRKLAAWPQTYQIILDGGGPTENDIMTSTYNIIPGSPVADAGQNQVVLPESTVTLDASGSHDSDGSVVSYTWTELIATEEFFIPVDPVPNVVLDGASSAIATFTAPNTDGEFYNTKRLVFELKITDDNGLISRDTVTVVVTPALPVANAGQDQTVDELTTVNLDSSATVSNSGSPLQYRWRQTGGPIIDLSGANTANPSFTAPDVATEAVLTFEVSAWDFGRDGFETQDAVSVTVTDVPFTNTPPVADAGVAQTVTEDDTVFLDGSASYDPDPGGTITVYSWVQTTGPVVTLTGADTATPSFVAPLVTSDTNLSFELTVTDDMGASSTANTSVLVQDMVVVDTTPPTTTSVVNMSSSRGTEYVDITLSADEPADIYFRVSGPSTVTYTACATPDVFQLYSCTITLEKKNADTVLLEYYAVDQASNTEATVTEEVR